MCQMEDLFGRIEIPVHEVVELKGGKEKITEKKFFPGYILVEMEMNDETWHLVRSLWVFSIRFKNKIGNLSCYEIYT